MSSLKNKTISGIHWVGSTQIIAQSISWLATILIARLLSPSDYGLMGMAMILISFIQFLNEFGLGTALIQKDDLQEVEIHSLFWFVCINSLFLFLIVYSAAPLVSWFFEEQRLILIIRVLAINFILTGVTTVPYSLLAKELDFKKRSKAVLFSNLLSISLVLALAIFGFGVWSLIFGSLCRRVTLAFFVNAYARYSPAFCFSLRKLFPLLRFGLNVTGSSILWYLYTNADNFIIAKVLGEKVLGLYSIAFNLSSMLTDKLSIILNPVAYSSFSKLQHNIQEGKQFLLSFIRGISALTFPALIGLAFIADDFVNTVLTSKWSPVAFPLRVLCVVGLIKSITFLMAPVLNARGKAHLNFRYNLISFLILCPSFLVGSMAGIEGIVCAWLIVYPPLAGYLWYMVFKEINLTLSEFVDNISHIFLSALFMLTFLFITKFTYAFLLSDWVRLINYIFVGLISYSVSLLYCSPHIRADISAFLVSGRKI